MGEISHLIYVNSLCFSGLVASDSSQLRVVALPCAPVYRKRLCRKPDFVHLFVDLKKYEGDPLSPPEGEAACGVYPLDPLFAIWLTL
jgi:hypothetical protein